MLKYYKISYQSPSTLLSSCTNHYSATLHSDPSFDDLISAYLASPEWTALADRTRYVWRLIIERIRSRWSSTQVSTWSEPSQLQEILTWRNERAHQPRTADHQITVLHHLLAWARLNGWITQNISTGIPRLYRAGGRADIIWLEDEIDRFCRIAPLPIADGMRLASMTGLRRADLTGLTWNEIEQFRIKRVTLKSRHRRKHAMIPVTPGLRSLLNELATRSRQVGVDTVLVNQKGKTWSGDGFTHAFNKVRDKLSVRHTDGRLKHLHDVRGTYATQLVRLGLSDQDIGDIMGWSAQQVGEIRKIYVEDDAALQAIINRLSAIE